MSEVILRPMLKQAGCVHPSVSVPPRWDRTTFLHPIWLECAAISSWGRVRKSSPTPGAKVAFKGQTITLLGSVEAPGGTISIAGGGKFAVSPAEAAVATRALPTVVLGPESMFSTAGTRCFFPTPLGRRLGTLYPGGTISVSGNIVASAGAVLDVSGASAIFDVHPTSLGDVGAPMSRSTAA